MRNLQLRTRLTLLVTTVFAMALIAAAAIGLTRIETSLETETRDNAEALLYDYLGQLQGGTVGPAQPDPDDATRFVYLDAGGSELTNAEFQQILFSAFDSAVGSIPLPDDFPPLPEGFPDLPEGATAEGVVIVEAGRLDIVIAEPGDDQPISLDLGEKVTTVGLPVTIGDEAVTIGVSSPLKPIQDSLDAMTQLFAVLVPLLTVLVAAGTWLLVGRSLRPVHQITTQVDQITTQNLEQRVPEAAATDEIGHLARTMNKMLAGLQTARDQQHQFISDASHELRSPITATQATLEVARANPDTTDWLATAEILHDENARLAALVDDLFLLARLDETDTPELRDDIDLEELFLDEARRPHPTNVNIRVESPARIRGDLSTLTRAARNLIDNAARHAASTVTVTIINDGTEATVTIADDGPGIDNDDLERIFERFTRLDDSRNRTSGGGAGLGLAITKHIITAHNGTINASNGPSGGAVFTLRFQTGTTITT